MPEQKRRSFKKHHVCDELAIAGAVASDPYINRSLENVRAKYRKVIDFMVKERDEPR